MPAIIGAQPASLSLQASARDMLKQLNVEVRGKTAPQFSKSGVLLIANHITAIDLFIMGSLTRQPFYFIGSQILLGLGGKWLQHIMPIYLSASRTRNLWDWPRKIVWRYRERITDEAQAHAYNLKVMEEAAQLLAKGETVLMFPSGRSLRGKWANGVGYLVHSLKNSPVKVALASIQPLPMYVHFFEFLPVWVLRLFPKVTAQVKWVSVFDLHEPEIQDLTPREITQWLREKVRG